MNINTLDTKDEKEGGERNISDSSEKTQLLLSSDARDDREEAVNEGGCDETKDFLRSVERLGAMAAVFVVGIALALGVFFTLFIFFDRKQPFTASSETNYLEEFYPEFGITTDGEFFDYCQKNYPEAFPDSFSFETDDADAIIANFKKYELPWAFIEIDKEKPYGGTEVAVLWLRDWFHWQCYIVVADNRHMLEGYDIDAGWLYRNGVRLKAFSDFETADMRPEKLISLYQSSTWSGKGIIRSEDYGTYAYIDDRGTLRYCYSEAFLSKDFLSREAWELKSIEYDQYQDPWWWNASDQEKAHIRIPDEEFKDDFDPEKDFRWHLENCIPDGIGGQVKQSCHVDYIMDLPLDYDNEIYAQTRVVWSDGNQSGTYILVQDGVEQYYAGNLIRRWSFDWNFAEANLGFHGIDVRFEPEPGDYEVFVYTGEQIIGLYADGRYGVFIDQIVSRVDSFVDDLYGLNGDQLVFWSGNDLYAIDEGIKEADFTEIKIFTKEDGCYLLIPERYGFIGSGDYHIQYLGREPLWIYKMHYGMMEQSKLW